MCFVVPCLRRNYTSDAPVQSNRNERLFIGASTIVTVEFGLSLPRIPPTQISDFR